VNYLIKILTLAKPFKICNRLALVWSVWLQVPNFDQLSHPQPLDEVAKWWKGFEVLTHLSKK